ncbi:YraN family protein [Vibrio sp. vnigr-6D03]|uniref:penicillin-binding protein activator n=1 Tax=Vibrio sp. vnigr-6D03 TaxID=2058088 RepID=UPI000C330F46|nr:penicillin-binding protein activator [Vibrio sp. vnigr-6D03]PKF79210.1 YraN family protein [Vibrio sp. vnigr-6D03]
MKHQNKFSVPRLLTPIALAVTLAACSTTSQTPVNIDVTQDPTQSAQAYVMQADSAKGGTQNDLLIMALKAALQENDLVRADHLVKRLSKQALSPVQMAEWQISRAQLLFRTGEIQSALQQLNYQPWWELNNAQWSEYHEFRAQLFELLSDHLNASREYIAANQYSFEDAQVRNHQNIWLNLSTYSEYDITSLQVEDGESELQGWLQLAVYMKTISGNPAQLKSTLETWFAANPEHPANIYTPDDVQAILALEIIKPTNTGLVLPLSGKYGKQGQLVRDGFIHAMMDDFNREDMATLTVLDSAALSTDEIQQELEKRHVDFVVGPLVKDKVEVLQQSTQLPMLALNIPDAKLPETRVCYFTLSPEQEVAQAAKYLFANGFQYPLILAPVGGFGERVTQAFKSEWEKYSKNPAAFSYFGNKSQLQKNINSVFGLADSQARIAQLNRLINIQTESQPRSRRDIDAVYVVAKSSELTLIKPFIEVAINPDTTPPKLFSNSRSNSGKKRQYEDLSGVVYSDIPMLIEQNSALKAQLEENWPKSGNVEKRLHALGMDAYKLILELPQMKVMPEYSVKGQTGTLTINNECVVQREVSWAEHEAI